MLSFFNNYAKSLHRRIPHPHRKPPRFKGQHALNWCHATPWLNLSSFCKLYLTLRLRFTLIFWEYASILIKFCSSFFAAQSWQLKFCHKNWASQKCSDYYQPEPVACKQPVMVLRVVPLWATVVLLRADYGRLLTTSNFVMGRASKL